LNTEQKRGAAWLSLLLLYVLVRGLLQVAIVPPWQHYDEPTHLEYAWLIAHRHALPQPEDYDQAMRRQVAASMWEHDFFGGLDMRPDLLSEEQPIWIGLSELRHPPLYYLLAALPLTLVPHHEIAFQLYAARLISLVLLVLSVWIAARLVSDLAPQHALRWAVPGMMAFLPAYLDLMTAVNNDVGATVAFSLFLWAALRLILRGVSPLRLLALLVTAALGVWTKGTTAVAVLLLPVVLTWALVRRPWPRWAWAGFLAGGLLLVIAVLSWGDAALWYRDAAQQTPTRQVWPQAPVGRGVLALDISPDEPWRQIRQPLPREDVEALRGQTVTLGGWMWATQPLQVRSSILADDRQRTWQNIEIGTSPTFQAITATVAADATWLEVSLQPRPNPLPAQTVTVYYDGLVLAAGEWPLAEAPRFADARGQTGQWAGQPFVNTVRNGSAETAWPRVRPWAETLLARYTHRSLAQFVASVLDWQRTGWVYGTTAVNLHQTFWARLAWGQVGLPAGWYWGLGIATLLGFVGALVALVRFWRSDQSPAVKRALGLLVLAGLLVWGNTFLRSHPLLGKPFIPDSRYAYPVIVPTTLALMGGWLALVPHKAKSRVIIGILAALALLDAVSVVTLVQFFYGR